MRPVDSSGDAYRDILCELVCSQLGIRLQAPVLVHVPIEHPRLGLGLISPYYGEKTIRGVARESIVNSHQLPEAFVFEELVMNIDDKVDHIRVREVENGKYEFKVVDHGHTLHAWKPRLQEPDNLDADTTLVQPSSPNNEYGIQSFSELQDSIRKFSSIPVHVVKTAIDTSFNLLEKNKLKGSKPI